MNHKQNDEIGYRAALEFRPWYGPTWYKAHNTYVVFRLMPAKRSICCNSIHVHLQTKITITVHQIGHRSLQFSRQPVRITVLLTSLWGNELPEVFMNQVIYMCSESMTFLLVGGPEGPVACYCQWQRLRLQTAFKNLKLPVFSGKEVTLRKQQIWWKFLGKK